MSQYIPAHYTGTFSGGRCVETSVQPGTYQGHHADGSSIQKHSAGGAYPYVLQLRDKPAGGYWWEMTGPGIEGALRFGSGDEWDAAARRILAVRSNADAWAFELEQLCVVAGHRQLAMHLAAHAWPGPAKWDDMSSAQRVSALLWLGKARGTLRLPPGTQQPVFARMASVAV